jgi:hypothetical protein
VAADALRKLYDDVYESQKNGTFARTQEIQEILTVLYRSPLELQTDDTARTKNGCANACIQK